MFLLAPLTGMAEENDSVKYVIQGTAPYNMEGKQVRISYSDSKGSHILCTSTVKKGKFSMQGVIPEPVIASIEIADQNLSNNLIALDGHPLKITTSYVDFKVIGGENNVRLLTFQKLENEFMDNLYRGLSQDFLRECGEREYDLLVNDMRMDALQSARTTLEALPLLRRGGLAVITLKLPEKGSLKKAREATACLAKEVGPVYVRQLYHNRSEITFVGEKL